jgi:hypothetical protein
MRLLRPQVFLIACLFIGCIASAQEGSSLGDVARKLREHNGTATSARPAGKAVDSSADKPASPASPRVKPPIIGQTPVVYEANIRALFQKNRFEEIDRIASDARASKVRLRGGYWGIHLLYGAVASPENPDAADSEWDANIARLKRWIAERPTSITPRVALASAYYNIAWRARGYDTADKVTDDAWQNFSQRMQLASDTLRDSLPLEKDPEWFDLMLLVARDEGADLRGLKAIFDRGVAFEPDYQYLYEFESEILMPRWLGDEEDLARFADSVANRIGGKQGDFIYYRIGAYVWCACEPNSDYKTLNYQRIKRGYLAQEELYGTANLAMNKMARMAASGEDWEFADELFNRIKEAWDAEVWHDKARFDGARQDASLFARGKKIEDALKIADANLLSPQGSNYSEQLASAFMHDYSFVARQCAFSAGDPNYVPFRLVIQLGKSGKVEKVYPSLMSNMSECMAEKVQQGVFPAPPQGSYWATVSLNSQN